MARAGRRVVYDQMPNFSGGLNATSSEVALGETQLREAVNVRLTQFGACTKRGGTQRITTNALHANGVTGLTEWDLSSGTRYILAVANGAMSYTSYGSFPVTFTGISGSLSTTVPIAWAPFRDSSGDALYVADGGLLNKLTVAAGPTFTLTTDIASTPAITDVEVFNQRLWACGSSTFPQAIFYSALNDGDTLGIGASGGGQINVRTFGQQNVTAIRALGTSLLIFHRGGISRLTGFGQDDILAVPAGVTGDVGTTAPDSIVRVGNMLFYVNVRGLFMANADGVMPVNTPEKPDPLAPILPTLTETQLAAVTAVFYKNTNELLIHVPSIGTYVYHTILLSWSGPWNGTYASASRQLLSEVGTASDVPVLLKGDSSGYIELLDAPSAFTDSVTAAGVAGTAFNMTATCRRLFSGDFADAKSYRWAYVVANLDGASQSVLSWQTGLTGGQRTLTQSTADALITEGSNVMTTEAGESLAIATASTSLRVPMWGTGYYVDVTLTDTSTEAAPSFSRVEVEGFSLGRR